MLPCQENQTFIRIQCNTPSRLETTKLHPSRSEIGSYRKDCREGG